MAKVHSIRSKAAKRTARPTLVHQFLIVLSGTDPLVWRRIQVPEKGRCPHTGAIIFAAPENQPPLTTDAVRELLSDFP